MKTLLIFIVLVGLAYFFLYDNGYDHLKSLVATHGSTSLAVATPIPTAKPAAPANSPSDGSFDTVTALLRQDLGAIPIALDGPGHPPVNAPTIKRRVGPYVNQHSEYQTLTQVCDLIIEADAQRSALQASCQAEQTRLSFGGTLNSTSAMDHPVPASGRALALQKDAQEAKLKIDQQAIHQRVESSWSSYRTRTAGQVQQLLASLAGKHI